MARTALRLSLVALLIRLAFLAWGANGGTADGLVYDSFARALLAGKGYASLDGSPAVSWVPGWPLALAGLYAVSGGEPAVAMVANAVFSASAVGLNALLGAALFGPSVGALTGLVCALWPGLVYYVATLHSEPLFSLVLSALLLCLARGARSPRARSAWLAAAGVLLGLCALIKAEAPLLAPVVAAFLVSVRRSGRELVLHAALLFGLAALTAAPWLARNQRVAGRLLWSANGGETAFQCNHRGATGRPDYYVAKRFRAECQRETLLLTSLELDRRGWLEARRFVREHPAEALGLVGRKLVATYGSDSDGERLVRFGKGDRPEWTGARDEWRWRVAPATSLALRLAADAYWYAVLALALAGAPTLRRWPPGAAVLVFGVSAAWLATHVVFCGSSRYHVPETASLALLAACGGERLRAAWRAR